ncbi:MAG: long-chain fatty acid--CoA ligase [Bacteroidales bacterium]|nr:long-chain fatty acid--CoA ligase [Bacteroidales bacterium]
MLNNCHLSKLIHEQAAHYGQRTALSWRDYDENRWKPVSWTKFSDYVRTTSVGLLQLGVGVQENIAVFSQNKPECLYVDFGAYGIRAVTIPFYATSSGAQVAYMINDAEIRFIFVGEQEQYDTTMSVMSVCHTLEKVIIFDPKVKRRANDHLSVYFEEFLAAADSARTEFLPTVEARTAEAVPEDVANILYTSGTTGGSKGVILTHGMYHEGFRTNDAVLPLGDKDVILNFLPFTHVFERAWSYLCLAEGARLAVSLRPTDVLQSLQEVHPTCMSSVPRFWEKVYQGVLERLETTSPLERKLIKGALNVGAECWTKYLSKGKPLPLTLHLKNSFYRRTVVKLLLRTLGLERANFFPTAGAAVSPDVERFVHAAGIYMVVGYGLTESTATVSCDHPGKVNSLGSVGRLIDGLEIKFGENEEILLRGKTITPGYYKKEAITKAAIDEEGWFHTGDAGYMKDGELYLKERIKDLFKTSNGKYIAPQMIESKLVIDKYIDQAVIVADKHKFVSALIVPDYVLLEKYAEANGIAVADRAALCQDERIHQMLAERIETLQQDLANYEKVKRFVLLAEPFTIANGELTNTLKVKRRVVYERYAAQIEKIYADAEKAAPSPTAGTPAK